MAAGEVLCKTAGKALAIDHKVPWKESSGRFQYGLNTPDGVNMVVLMVEDTLRQNVGHGAMAVDGENAFNAAKRQAILDRLYATFPQLAIFVETWYLDPSPLWYYLNDHVVAIIWSREGIQQGDVIATFLFSNIYAPILENIYRRASPLCSTMQLFAILDDITFTAPVHLLSAIFVICTEELSTINIRTVPRKSHILTSPEDRHLLPDDLDPQIQIHTDGISILGTAIGADDFVAEFLNAKLQQTEALLIKVNRIPSLQSRYQILKLSINSRLRHLLRSLSSSRPPVSNFCKSFDQLTQGFFMQTFHIQEPSDALSLQLSMSTSYAGMGILSLQHMASAAYLASLRNMLGEFIVRNAHSVDVNQLLTSWSFEQDAKWHWDNHHLLVDQMQNSGEYTQWNHVNFLALPQQGTQRRLQQAYSRALYTFLFLLVDQCRAIKYCQRRGMELQPFYTLLRASQAVQCPIKNLRLQ